MTFLFHICFLLCMLPCEAKWQLIDFNHLVDVYCCTFLSRAHSNVRYLTNGVRSKPKLAYFQRFCKNVLCNHSLKQKSHLKISLQKRKEEEKTGDLEFKTVQCAYIN